MGDPAVLRFKAVVRFYPPRDGAICRATSHGSILRRQRLKIRDDPHSLFLTVVDAVIASNKVQHDRVCWSFIERIDCSVLPGNVSARYSSAGREGGVSCILR